MNMLELIGIPKTKTKKKKKIERIFRQKIVSSRRERKNKSEGKNNRNDK